MFDRSRIRARIALIASSTAIVLFMFASTAEARLERLRWTHPRADVVSFDVRVRTLGEATGQVTSLGSVTPDGDGVYIANVDVDGDVDLAVRAYGPGGAQSVWTSPLVRLSGGGPPPPPPPPVDPTVPPGAGTEIPETPGASARYDFDGSTPGPAVSGWVDTAANYSLSPDDSLFDVIEIDGNRMLHTSSTADSIHSHRTGSAQSVTNYELRGRMAIDHPDGEIGITSYSGYPSNDVYYRVARMAGQSFRFVGRPGVACATNNSGLVPAAGDWIRFELDVIDEGNVNRIRAKLWRQGTPEPSTPQIECVDGSPNRPTLGTIGVYAGGTGQKFWDDLEIIEAQSGGGNPDPDPDPPSAPFLIDIVPVDP